MPPHTKDKEIGEINKCKKCGDMFIDYFEAMKHTNICFPKDYQGVLLTGYKK